MLVARLSATMSDGGVLTAGQPAKSSTRDVVVLIVSLRALTERPAASPTAPARSPPLMTL